MNSIALPVDHFPLVKLQALSRVESRDSENQAGHSIGPMDGFGWSFHWLLSAKSPDEIAPAFQIKTSTL
jgi:hypothetical protein